MALARALFVEPDLLLLDEPTNRETGGGPQGLVKPYFYQPDPSDLYMPFCTPAFTDLDLHAGEGLICQQTSNKKHSFCGHHKYRQSSDMDGKDFVFMSVYLELESPSLSSLPQCTSSLKAPLSHPCISVQLA